MIRVVPLLWMMLVLATGGGGGGGDGGGSTPPPTNGAPMVNSTDFTLDQDTGLSATLTASDPENATVTFTKTGDPTHGQIVAFAANGAFTYRPDTGFVGADSFAISVSDGTNAVATTITLTVKVPGPPVSGPTVTLGFAAQQVTLTWMAVADATFYRVLKNPDNRSGPVQVGEDLSVTRYSDAIGVHVTDWVNASYIVQACNAGGCADSTAQFLVPADSSKAVGYFKASNTAEEGYFGFSVSLSGDGDTLAVGAIGESSAATGVNGDQGNSSAANAGAVYVFTRSGSTWAQQAYVKASNTRADDEFGYSLSLSGDGNTLAVGALFEDSAATGVNGNQSSDTAANAGAVYVFTRSGSTWSQQAYVKASNTGAGDQFGESLSLSGDGNTLAVGAIGEDSAATGVNGAQNSNTESFAGAAYVFTRRGSTWSQQAYVKASNTGASDQFGQSLSLSGDGGTLAVGAVGEASAATGVNGNQSNNTAADAGAVYVFTRSGSAWSQQAYVKASNSGASDFFGQSLSLSSDGDTLAVGATGESSAATGVNGSQSDNTAGGAGAVYVLARSASTWSQQAYVKASNPESSDFFGYSVSLSRDGDTLAVGAFGESSAASGVSGDQSDNTAFSAGAVYVLTRSGSTWSQQSYVKASNTAANDYFGGSLSLSGDGDTLAVGAADEDGAATAVNGDQSDNTAPVAGAVYLY